MEVDENVVTEWPRLRPTYTMAMAKLKEIQDDAGCDVNVMKFLDSYVKNCLDRKEKNQPLLAAHVVQRSNA